MSLFDHLAIGLVHLFVAAMDVVILILLLNFINHYWNPLWLQPMVKATEPFYKTISECFQRLIYRLSGTRYSQRTETQIMVFGLCLIRILIDVFVLH